MTKTRKTSPERLERERQRYLAKREEIKARTAAYRRANLEGARAYDKAYREANAAEIKAKRAARYAANKEKANARSQAYYAQNKDKAKEAQRKWRDENQERLKVIRSNRDERVKASGGKLTPGLVDRLLMAQRWKCACCGASLKAGYHLDHVMPLALGGEHADHNMQLLAPLCNLRKRDMHPIDWAQKNGRLL